jgi:hypothetical protein
VQPIVETVPFEHCCPVAHGAAGQPVNVFDVLHVFRLATDISSGSKYPTLAMAIEKKHRREERIPRKCPILVDPTYSVDMNVHPESPLDGIQVPRFHVSVVIEKVNDLDA